MTTKYQLFEPNSESHFPFFRQMNQLEILVLHAIAQEFIDKINELNDQNIKFELKIGINLNRYLFESLYKTGTKEYAYNDLFSNNQNIKLIKNADYEIIPVKESSS